jgi:chaperonin GroEL
VLSPETSVGFDSDDASELLGSFDRATVESDETTFLGGDGDQDKIRGRIEDLRTRSDRVGSEYDQEFLQKRLSQLSGGMSIIRVGGETEYEMKQRKALVEDSLNATQASIKGGIVAGGGYMLFRASLYLDKIQSSGEVTFDSEDQEWGWNILKETLDAPARHIVENAGYDPSPVMHEMEDYYHSEMGFDVRDGTYKDFYEEGIIDASIVVEEAVISAVSSVSSLIMSGAAMASVS